MNTMTTKTNRQERNGAAPWLAIAPSAGSSASQYAGGGSALRERTPAVACIAANVDHHAPQRASVRPRSDL